MFTLILSVELLCLVCRLRRPSPGCQFAFAPISKCDLRYSAPHNITNARAYLIQIPHSISKRTHKYRAIDTPSAALSILWWVQTTVRPVRGPVFQCTLDAYAFDAACGQTRAMRNTYISAAGIRLFMVLRFNYYASD